MFNIIEMIDEEISKVQDMTPSEFAAYVASEGEYDPIWDDIYNITKSLTDMGSSYFYGVNCLKWPSVVDEAVVQYRRIYEPDPIYCIVEEGSMDLYDSVAEAA